MARRLSSRLPAACGKTKKWEPNKSMLSPSRWPKPLPCLPNLLCAYSHTPSPSIAISLTHSLYHRAHMERARAMIQLAHAAQRLNLCISSVIRGSVCLNAGAWSVRCLMGSAASVQAILGTRVGKTYTQPFNIWPSGALKIQDSHLFRGCPRCRGHNPCGGTDQRTSCSCGW